MIVVSACLAGIPCRYNGTGVPDETVLRWLAAGKAVAVCPEVLGGLPVPRPATELVGEKVMTADGEEVTEAFQNGAQQALRIACEAGCRRAVLKARSPSCGCGLIYDGTFSGRLIAGDGIFARLLMQAGIPVTTEEEIVDEIA